MHLQGNLNGTVWVKLTEVGLGMYMTHLRRNEPFGGVRVDPRICLPDEDTVEGKLGYHRFQLHTLMYIFGPFYATSRQDMPPIEGHIIHFSSPYSLD